VSTPEEKAAARPPDTSRKGPLAWMASNSVAANLLLILFLFGGAVMLSQIKQEVFPEFDLDMIVINVPYPGASPAEVEQGVILAVEEQVRGLDGVKEVRSTALEGVGVVTVELLLGTNTNRALADVKSAVDRITSLPEDAERPIISAPALRRNVISVIVSGDQDEATLRAIAENVRNDLLEDEHITTVELSGVRPPEIAVEIPQESLRRYGLTLEGVARTVRSSAVEVPGGGVKTRSGEVLLRTAERRRRGSEFEDIAVLSRPDGSQVNIRDVGTVVDGFRETDEETFFNGQRAVVVDVYRVGEERPTEVADAVKDYVERTRAELPPGLQLTTWADMSEIYRDRIDLLLHNAYLGLFLVLLLLGLFLEIRLAFWVTLGIPTSFIGGLLFLPAADISINMISLFAFIVTLGMVVDDAIVVGEAIHQRRQDGMGRLDAAIAGVREVASPVVFSALTTCIAFMPLMFVPGVSGKFFRNIPIVVIAVLLVSLVESLVILPAHLANSRPPVPRGIGGFIHEQQQRFSRFLEWLIDRTYRPTIRMAVDWRYLTVAIGVALWVGSCGLVAGGRVEFTFMPKIDSDWVTASLEMPFGTSVEDTRRTEQRLVETVRETLTEMGGEAQVSRGIIAQLGSASSGGMGSRGGSASAGSHLAQVRVLLVPSGDREFSAGDVARRWRARMGEVPGAEKLTFDFTTGATSGSPIDIQLSHADMGVLEAAAARLAGELREFAGVKDVDDGFAAGKEQLDFHLRPEARSLGLTEIELARQVRSAFYGAEALRQQRGRDEVRVIVRRPLTERTSLYDVEQLVLSTPGGGEIPFAQAATVDRGRSYTQIGRVDGKRVVHVTGDVIEGQANANKVVADVTKDVLPEIMAQFPGVSYSLGGQQKSQAETIDALAVGFAIALVAMFALLAVAFRSYAQPAIVMLGAIPFGWVGALGGHVLMGYDLSLISMMGVVALSGVVVNASLILIMSINEHREAGLDLLAAIEAGGARRFRPIILTSLTTFFGLVPMISETSLQARFLIPMAISLGFGVLFATFITLVLVPACYAILEDIRRPVRAVTHFVWGDDNSGEPVSGE